VHTVAAKAFCATRLHFLAAFEEVPYTLSDVIVDFPIGGDAGPVGEIGGPASQDLVETVTDFRPRSDVSGYQ